MLLLYTEWTMHACKLCQKNARKFLNKAQRLIKCMKGGHSLSYQLESTLIWKVCSTQSEYFNRTMYNYMDKVLAMEKLLGPHRDPCNY